MSAADPSEYYYAGAPVPGSRYRKDKRVEAVMVEVNGSLYLREDDAAP